MSDKLNLLTSNIIRFVAGERPTADKFNAMNLYYTRAVDNICRAIGDMNDKSAFGALSPQWNPNENDLEGRPLDIANLARLIGPASNLNPKMFGENSVITEYFNAETVNSKKELELNYNAILALILSDLKITRLSSDGSSETSLVLNTSSWSASSENEYNIRTEETETTGVARIKLIYLHPSLSLAAGESLKVEYSTLAEHAEGGINYYGASFNTIPDPNEASGLGSDEITDVSGEANGWSYKIDLSLRKIKNQQSGSHNLSLSSVESEDEFNNDTSYSLPEWWASKFNLDGEIQNLPSGLIYLKNIDTGEIYLTAEYAASDTSTIYIKAANLCLTDEHRLILVGTDITTSIDDLRNKMFNHRHDGSFGEPFIRIQDLIGKFVTGEFGPSSIPGNEFPMYLHRKGYQIDNHSPNGNNAMLGDLVLGRVEFDGIDEPVFDTPPDLGGVAARLESVKLAFSRNDAYIHRDEYGVLKIINTNTISNTFYGENRIEVVAEEVKINSSDALLDTEDTLTLDQNNIIINSSDTSTITSDILKTDQRIKEDYVSDNLITRKSSEEKDFSINTTGFYHNRYPDATYFERVIEERASKKIKKYSYEIDFVPDAFEGSHSQSNLTPCFEDHARDANLQDPVFLSTALARMFIRDEKGTILNSAGSRPFWINPGDTIKSLIHVLPYLNGNFKLNYWQCFPIKGNAVDTDTDFPYLINRFKNFSERDLGVLLWKSTPSSSTDEQSFESFAKNNSSRKIVTFGNQKKISYIFADDQDKYEEYYNYTKVNDRSADYRNQYIRFNRNNYDSLKGSGTWWRPKEWYPSYNNINVNAVLKGAIQQEDANQLGNIEIDQEGFIFRLRLSFLNTPNWGDFEYTTDDPDDGIPSAWRALRFLAGNVNIKVTRPVKYITVNNSQVKIGGVSWLKGAVGTAGSGADYNDDPGDDFDSDGQGSEFDFRLTKGRDLYTDDDSHHQDAWHSLVCKANKSRLLFHNSEFININSNNLSGSKVYELLNNWLDNEFNGANHEDWLSIEICWTPRSKNYAGTMTDYWLLKDHGIDTTGAYADYDNAADGVKEYVGFTMDCYGNGGGVPIYSSNERSAVHQPRNSNGRYYLINEPLTSDFVGVNGQYLVLPRFVDALSESEEKEYSFNSIMGEQNLLRQNQSISSGIITTNVKDRFYIGKLCLNEIALDENGTVDRVIESKEWIDFPNIILLFTKQNENVDFANEFDLDFCKTHPFEKNNSEKESNARDNIFKTISINGEEMHSSYLKKIDLSLLLKIYIFKKVIVNKYFHDSIGDIAKKVVQLAGHHSGYHAGQRDDDNHPTLSELQEVSPEHSDGGTYEAVNDSDYFKFRFMQTVDGTLSLANSDVAARNATLRSSNYTFGVNFNLNIKEKKISENSIVINIELITETACLVHQ